MAKGAQAGPSLEISSKNNGKRRRPIQLRNSVVPKPTVFDTATSIPRNHTVSIALPGSIICNAQSAELKTYLAGQVARAAAIFNVDEIVVFSEDGSKEGMEGDLKTTAKKTNENVFLARVLQYLECPQYLRKFLFPMHRDLRFAGLLNPLDAPHHLRTEKICKYREGVSIDRPGKGTWVHVGLMKEVLIPEKIPPNVRLTVSLDSPEDLYQGRFCQAHAVPPSRPREDLGMYWGYTTRLAAGLPEVFSKCPYEEGYDLALGTSERGEIVQGGSFTIPPFKHLIVVFGGLAGLESCIGASDELPTSRVEDLFDNYINTCINQGSRTIRTEEAILVSMSVLHPLIINNTCPE